MKKFFMALVLGIISTLCFGQLKTMTVENFAGYKTVYSIPMGYGEIRYIDNCFYLLVTTDNQFEKHMASVELGRTKESAICTLNDLKNFSKTTK